MIGKCIITFSHFNMVKYNMISHTARLWTMQSIRVWIHKRHAYVDLTGDQLSVYHENAVEKLAFL